MPERGESSRFNRANGPRLRALRKSRGWSQLELATRAGYSERVIRKAEAGETVRHDVLSTLAQTLSTEDEAVSVPMLAFDPVAAVRRFFEIYDRHEIRMLAHMRDLLTEDVRFIFHADPSVNPLSGTWPGFEGLQAYLDLFFGMFVRCNPEPIAPVFSVSGDQVVARYSEVVRHGDIVAPPVWIHLIFTFRGDQICQVEDFCDTDTAARFLKEIGKAGNRDDENGELSSEG